MKQFSPDRALLVLCVVYCAAHFLLLFNSGIFWDDYTIFRIDPVTNIATFRDAGAAYAGYFHNFVSRLPHAPLVYRSIIFLSYLVSALCLYRIVQRLSFLDPCSRFFVAAFCAVLPVNGARVTFICSPYAISHAFFFLAFLLLARYLEEKRAGVRLLSLVLFSLSFFTGSLLVFYALPLLYLLYREVPEYRGRPGAYLLPVKYGDYFLLAPLFWVLRSELVTTSGVFKNYNKLSLAHLLAFPQRLAQVTSDVAGDLAGDLLGVGLLPFLVCFVLCLLATGPLFPQGESAAARRGLACRLLGLGALFFALGLFPYLAVGLTPQVHSWNSRHLLLAPLGLSLVIIALSRLLVPRRVLPAVLAGLLAAMILVDVNGYLVLQKEWYKWSSVTAQMRGNAAIRNHTSFLVRDEAAQYNFSTNCCRFYEYAGMMKRSFGDERRFARDVQDTIDLQGYGGIGAFLNASYGLSEYRPVPPQYLITIGPGRLRPDQLQTVRLMMDEICAGEEFQREVAELVTLKVKKISVVPRAWVTL